MVGFLRTRCPLPLRLWEQFLLQPLVAYEAFLAICQSGAFPTQPRVWSHGAVVDEAPLALLARLAAFAASVERSFELSPAMLEVGSRFLLLAGGASVWPRLQHRSQFCHWPFFLSSANNAVKDRDPKWQHSLQGLTYVCIILLF